MNIHIATLRRLLSFVLLGAVIFFITSCDDDDTPPPAKKVNIDNVSLNLDFNFTTTGNIIVAIRDTETNDEISSSTVSIEGFTDTNDGWIDFAFSPVAIVEEGRLYQLEVKRTAPNTPFSDVALWRSAVGNVYPHGEHSSSSGTTLDGDFAFRTYIDGILDQEQALTDEITILNNSYILIQGFTPKAE